MKKIIFLLLLVSTIVVAAPKIQNEDIKSNAAIDATKLIDGSVSNTELGYINTLTSNVQTQINAKATNPMTTAEDLIKGGASGAPTRLAVGLNGECLTISGGVVGWGACGTSSPLTTKGDLYTYDTGNARLAVGTNGQVLTANSATATGLEWATPSTGGDFSSNTATSVDGEVVLFSGTGGKTGKRATGTGVAKLSSGVLSASNVDLTSEVTGVLPLANGGTNKNATAVNGGIVYSDADSFEILAAGSSGQFLQSNGAAAPSWATAPNGDAIQKAINQTGHGLAVGDVIRYNGTAYVEAQANSDANAEVIGIVSAVADANNFTFVSNGFVSGLSGLTAGETYFLSPTTAGAITTTDPSGAGQVSKPVFLAVSTTTGYFIQSRGYVVGGNGGSGGVTNWVASSATVNCSSAGTTELFERMEGDSLRIRGTFSCTTAGAGTPSINIGGGRTFNTSKMQTIATPKLGEWIALTGGNNAIYNQVQEGHLFYDLSDNDDVFYATNRASKNYTKITNFGSIFGSTNTEAMNVDFLVPLN